MANSFKINSNFTVKKFSSNKKEFKELPPLEENESKLQTQYENLQETLAASGQYFDNRNWMEKILGINADTKEHAGVLGGTLDILTRPLDAIKASVYDLEKGKGGQEIFQDLIQGITQGKGKNLSGTQILGLENAHLDTFTKFIVNVGVDIGLDPLTYVPAGAIFKGLKKVGTQINKIPEIQKLLEHSKSTELGVATKNLYITTKNQFGKMFKWMYGTSDEAKFLFTKYEADKAATTHDLFSKINTMLSVRPEIGKDLFNYVNTNQLPSSSFLKGLDEKTLIKELDTLVEGLGIGSPEYLFKKWAKENYNGNIETAKKNLIGFISDPKIKNFKQDWDDYLLTGNWLKADGTIKDELEAAQSFWLKKTKEWQQLTPEEITMRFNDSIYESFLATNPPEKTMNTIMKGINSGDFPLNTNNPDAIKKFLTWFSDTAGLEDPLLKAKYVKMQARDSKGHLIKELDTARIDENVRQLAYKQDDLRQMLRKKDPQVMRINDLKKEIELLEKNIKYLKKGKYTSYFVDISNGIPADLMKEMGIKSAIPSAYFDVKYLKDYGKTGATNYERMLDTMKLSKDPSIRLEYQKLMAGNELNTVRNMLKDAEGKGVLLSVKSNWNQKGVQFLDENKNVINAPQHYVNLNNYGEKRLKKHLSDEIKKGINLHLKGKYESELLSEGVLGKTINKWKEVDGLTKENAELVAKKVADDILNTKAELPAFKLTKLKGYFAERYVQDLTYLNSEMYRLIKRFDLDPEILQKANILRNVTNPEIAKHMRLIEIQKHTDLNKSLSVGDDISYSGLDPARVLNSKWISNALEINHALGYKLISTDPLESIVRNLQVLPESLSVASMMRQAVKTGDIKVLDKLEKISYEFKKVVPSGKKLIKSSDITSRLEGIKDLIPKADLEEFETILEQFKEEKNLLISVGLDDQLQNVIRVKKEAPKIADYLNKYISVWKKAVLLTPGYHMRNMFGNLAQSVSAGIPMDKLIPELNKSFKDINQVHKITDKINTQLKTTKELLDTDEKFINFTKSFLTDKEHLLFHEYSDLMKKGVTGQSKINSDYWEVMNKLGKTSVKNSKFKKGWDTVFNANMKLSQVMDDGMRLAVYRMSMKDTKYALKMGLIGDTPEELASSFVRTAFFDYNALTNFEKNTMRKILPFYTWSRKNLEYQVRTLINRPEKFSRMLKIFNDWNQAQGYSTDETPDWVKDNMWLPIMQGDNIKYIKVGLPQQDIGEVFSGNGQVLSRLNPFYKLALESITGQNIFTRQATTPLKSIQGMFWQPIQKLLVQPFDIPVGALPLGNGKTLGEVFGHPNNYSQRNSIWYEQNIQSLHQSYLWQQINKLVAFRQHLKAVGIEIQTKQQLMEKMKKQTFPTRAELNNYKQIKLKLKDLKF